MEQLPIDAARQQFQAFEAAALQFDALAAAGHQGQLRTVVEPAQVAGQRPGQQADAVMPGVLLEVGVKAADHRDLQALRGTQGGQAERAFGGDIEHIGAMQPPLAQQLVQGRLAPLQAGIARQRPATGEQQLVIALAAVVSALPRTHQLQAMAARAQAVDQAPEGIGHAIDFRREGFADQGDKQR